jgi:hypothetical protein
VRIRASKVLFRSPVVGKLFVRRRRKLMSILNYVVILLKLRSLDIVRCFAGKW